MHSSALVKSCVHLSFPFFADRVDRTLRHEQQRGSCLEFGLIWTLQVTAGGSDARFATSLIQSVELTKKLRKPAVQPCTQSLAKG